MRKHLLTLAIMALLSLNLVAQAAEVKGHKVPSNLTTENTQLTLNGAGMRNRFMISLYVAGLYLAEKNQNADQIIAANDPMAIRLHVVSGLITSEKMAEATLEGFKNATKGELAPIQSEIDLFMQTFQAEIKEGDVFELIYVPSEGVKVFKNGSHASTVKGQAFKQALFGIWLSDKPAQRSLKREMLGS